MRKLTVLLLVLISFTTAFAEDAAQEVTFDGLQRIESAKVGAAYIDPAADFSVFRRVAILDPHVAFRANWQRDQNRNRSRNIRSADMERIKADVAALFREVFTEQLEAAGYEIVNVANEDVLILYLQLVDSLSGAAIGRAVDRQSARRAGGTVGWSNRVTNRAEARRVVVRWADILVDFLRASYYEPNTVTADDEG
jgi:hypothetical protein